MTWNGKSYGNSKVLMSECQILRKSSEMQRQIEVLMHKNLQMQNWFHFHTERMRRIAFMQSAATP